MNIPDLKGPKNNKQYTKITFHDKGGMGEIYSAFDTILNQNVAIKLIPIPSIDDKKLLETEIEISLSLDHENIIKTYYADSIKIQNQEYFYIIMDFYKNGNYRNFLSNQKSNLPISDCIEYMLELSSGLEEANKKVIHRDLKPENILIANSDKLIISDFGLSKYIDTKTRTKTFKGWGTLPYMAPECWLAEPNTVAMDIYSLGIIFFEILTLRLPFEGKNENEFKEMHLFSPLPDLHNFRKDVPIRIIQMIIKMSNKRKNERYNSVSEIIKILREQKNPNNQIDVNPNLLEKVHRKISQEKEKKLKEIKEIDSKKTYNKYIVYSINSIFDDFKNIINSVNESLELEKINLEKNIDENNPSNCYLLARFLNSELSIYFFPMENLQSFNTTQKNKSIQRQKQQHGVIFHTPKDTYIHKDKIKLIGLIKINEKNYGFNIILRSQEDNDMYGEWWCCWFDDSGLMHKPNLEYHYHYPLTESDFYNEYEYGRTNVTHIRNMRFQKFERKDIEELIEQML